MPQHDARASSFEELWQKVVAEPVQGIEPDEDDTAVLSADNLVAWLERVADDCLADGLIDETGHGQLRAASATYAQILGAVPPDRLSAKLKTLGELDD